MKREHVEIVKRGKEAIDQWRRIHPGERLDLSFADLSQADLSGANLSRADLRNAILGGGAELRSAYLARADLTGAILTLADLSEADLFQANLIRADLTGANLSKTNLSETKLLHAQLREADLSKSKIVSANLFEANLFGGNLSGADLTDADLFGCQLVRASLAGAKLTGAKLYGTARDDWKIEGVKCRYVFWDREGRERSPRDRELEPGEFEQLYAQLPTIEYVFENGVTPLDPLVMDRIVQAINERHPEFELQIDSINARGIYPTIRFTVRQEEQKAAALEAVTHEYQISLARIEGKYEALLDAYDRVLKGQAINIGSNSVVAIGGSTINVEEYIHHLEEIEQAIKEAPLDSLAESVKRQALDTLNGAMKDMARNKFKDASDAVVGLAAKLGPRIASTSAFQFFKDLAERSA